MAGVTSKATCSGKAPSLWVTGVVTVRRLRLDNVWTLQLSGESYSSLRAARTAVRKRYSAVAWRADARFPGLRAFLVRGLTIFLFHEVTNSPSPMQLTAGIYTPTSLFAEQIDWLRQRFTFIRPTQLSQFGADQALPENAALVTFDDSWSGIFRVALPLLESMGVPSICFINMATVSGDPDLSAVRAYEQQRLSSEKRLLGGPIDMTRGAHIIFEARDRYAADSEFLAFQGSTATLSDLDRAVSSLSLSWFGSHLFHHWEVHEITPELYEHSLRENNAALSDYSNALPVYALPGGYPSPGDSHALSLPLRFGYRVVMTAMGRQNPDPRAAVLDRLPLPITRSTPSDWWHACHRLRILDWALKQNGVARRAY